MTLFRPVIAALVAAMTVAAVPAVAQDAKPAENTQAAEQMPEGRVLPDIALGEANAPLTIVEYASFTCPHCAAFHDENLPKLKAEYIDTGKVRFTQRDVYFDEPGRWAGILARCGGEEKFYPIAGMLFEKQREWLGAKTGDELAANLRKIGAAAGFSGEQMDACWKDQAKVESLLATFQQNAVADKIEGTPTFIIGGETVRNAPWEELKAKIDEKLAAAPTAAN